MLDLKNPFNDIDGKLKKTQLLERRKLKAGRPFYGTFSSKYLDIFQVAENTMIARERYSAHVDYPRGGCVIYFPSSEDITNSNYYLIKDGKHVTNQEEVKQTIKDTLGITLEALSKEKGMFDRGVSKFVTEVKLDKKIDPEFYHEQPDEIEIAGQLSDAKEKLSNLAEEFGFENERVILNNIQGLAKTINVENRKYAPIAKKYRESKEREFDSIGAMFKKHKI